MGLEIFSSSDATVKFCPRDFYIIYNFDRASKTIQTCIVHPFDESRSESEYKHTLTYEELSKLTLLLGPQDAKKTAVEYGNELQKQMPHRNTDVWILSSEAVKDVWTNCTNSIVGEPINVSTIPTVTKLVQVGGGLNDDKTRTYFEKFLTEHKAQTDNLD